MVIFRACQRLLFLVAAICILVLGCIGSDNRNGAETSGFRHWVIDPAPNTGKECCTDVLMVGDINGDGKMDVLIGAEHAEGPGLVWYQYPTWEKHSVAAGDFTTDGQLADVDGDGDLDIVIGTFADGKGEILWFEHVFHLGQEKWVEHKVGNGYAHDVAVGDLNGDGQLDLVTCDKKKVTLWTQVSKGKFEEQTVVERAGEGIAVADIDGDGYLDIVYGGSWLENPKTIKGKPWSSHPISQKWSPDTRVAVADMNRDGRLDVVLSVSEGNGPLSWFEAPENRRDGSWKEHPVEKEILEGAHSLQVADFDGNGSLDIVTAEMHTSSNKRVIVYLKEAGAFRRVILSRHGSHNMRVADIDGDGDFDIVGKNYGGPNRTIEMWENMSSRVNQWSYIPIDASRPKSQKGKMGLLFTDINGDGFPEAIAGSYLYVNPAKDLHGQWRRYLPAGESMDFYFAIGTDQGKPGLVGIENDGVYLVRPSDETDRSWSSKRVATVPAGARTQGYVQANLVPGKPQLIFTRGKNLFVLKVPDNIEGADWPLFMISTQVEEEGLGVGDIDGDGDIDIAAVHADGHHVIWLENPGDLTEEWKAYVVGEPSVSSQVWLDRIVLADMDGDGRLDIVATEERQDWKLKANLYMFKGPVAPRTERWERRIVARHRSLNSMGVADMDGDGILDIVVAEHTDQKSEGADDNLTVAYLNRDAAKNWVPELIDRGPHSSHLGAKLVDLDNDGILEVVSVGWSQYRHVHLWKRSMPFLKGAD